MMSIVSNLSSVCKEDYNTLLKDCSLNFKRFFDWALQFCLKHNKQIILEDDVCLVNDGIRYSGECNGDTIKIAVRFPMFEEIFVHEFSHLNQAVYNSKYWKDNDFWLNLSIKNLNIPTWNDVLETIALERDCDLRSLTFSRKWNLFDNQNYAKKVNLYLYYYQFVFLENQWYNSTTIYHPKILEVMPSRVLPITTFQKINMDIMNLFFDCLNEKGKYYNLDK